MEFSVGGAIAPITTQNHWLYELFLYQNFLSAYKVPVLGPG